MAKGAVKALPETPAKLDAGNYIADRVLSKVAGAPLGFRNMTPLEVGYRKGRLGKGYEAEARFRAGMTYHEVYLAAQKPSSRDSTDLGRVCGGSGGDGSAVARIAAQSRLNRVRDSLGFMDGQIIEMFCGEEQAASQVISKLFGKRYEDATWGRISEALDSLIRVS